MEQDDLIKSIENPELVMQNSEQTNIIAQQEQQPTASPPMQEIAPLPQDLSITKRKKSIFEIMNLIAYIVLGIMGAFLLILFILGFV